MNETHFIGPVGNDFILYCGDFLVSFILMLPICFLINSILVPKK